MTAAGADSAGELPAQVGGDPDVARAGRDELRPVGPRDRRDRPLQDRLRRPRGRVHRGVGPRPRPARAAGLRARPGRPRPGRAAASRAARRGLGVGVRGRRRGRRRVTETLRDRDPWPVEGPIRVEREPPPAWDERTVDAARRPRPPVAGVGGPPGGERLAAALLVEPGGPGVLALLRPWPQIGGGQRVRPARPGLDRLDRRRRRGPSRRGRGTCSRPGASTSSPPTPRSPATPATPTPSPGPASTRSRRSSRRATGCRCRSPAADEEAAFAGISKSTRQRIRQAESSGVVVVRHDARLARGGLGEGFSRAAGADPGRPGPLLRPAAGDRRAAPLLVRAARVVRRLVDGRPAGRSPRPTSRRRHRAATPWPGSSCTATAGGCRPSTAATTRRPDATIRARCTCSAGGRSSSRSARDATRWTLVASTWLGRDANRARATPTFGLYQHKKSFGAEWVELAGAHEKVIRRQPLPGRPGDVEAVAAARPAAGRRCDRRLRHLERGVTAVATIDALLAAAEPREPRPLGGARRAADVAAGGSSGRATAARRSGLRRSRMSRSGASPTTRAGCARGRCSSRSKASTSTATTCVARGGRRRRRGRPRRACRSRTAALPQLVVASTRAALAEAAAWWYGDPSPRARHRRHHRHGRQDDDVVPRRGGPRGRRSLDRAHRDRRDEGRRAARGRTPNT